MNLLQRFRRWLSWKRLTVRDRLYVARMQMTMVGPDSWEVRQLKKEQV